MFIKVSVQGKPARLHLEGVDLILDVRDGDRTPISLEQALEMLNASFEVQKIKARDILSASGSIWVIQPAFKDCSLEMERLASALDEVHLRMRANQVRLASVQPVREPVRRPVVHEVKTAPPRVVKKPSSLMMG